MRINKPCILIVDSHSSANRGDAAILQALLDSLREELPRASFKVHSTFPALATVMHGVAANPPLIRRPTTTLDYTLMLLKIGLFLLLGLAHRYGLDLAQWLPKKKIFKIYRDFIEADLIVGMGGGFYNDNYYQSLPGRLFHLFLGKLLQKPVVISAHSVGPFRRSFYRWLTALVFRRLDLICLRDEESLAHLALMNLDRGKVKVVADSAWLLPAASVDRAKEILRLEQVPPSRPLVSLALVQWRFFQTKAWPEGYAQYLEAIAAVTTKLIRLKHCHVVFLSTNTSLGGHPTDDRKTAGDALALLEPDVKAQTTLVKGEYRPEEIKALYGQMMLHIGTRMHSVILAAAMQTPVVGIAYEFKMFGVMKALGLEEYVSDIENLNEDELWQKISAAIDKQEQLQKAIAKALPVLQSQAKRNAQLIADTFRYHAQSVSHHSVVKSV